MKVQVHWYLMGVFIALIILWQVSLFTGPWGFRLIQVGYSFNSDIPAHRLGHMRKNESDSASSAASTSKTKCDLFEDCPSDSFAFSIRSGAANIVGPRICFDGKIVMSHVLNNVSPGLNIVLVNGRTGDVEAARYFNRRHTAEALVQFLTNIPPGRIVLAASFEDLAEKLTNESRDLIAKLGSNLLKSLKSRDSWVFVGSSDSRRISAFEKLCPNDEQTNVYEGWPDIVELGSCFPRIVADADQTDQP